MSAEPGMTARALMEKAANAALATYIEAVGFGTRRVEAERAYRDHILKAADRYALDAEQQRRVAQIRARELDAALAAIRDPDAAARRASLDDELSAATVRKLRQTAGAR